MIVGEQDLWVSIDLLGFPYVGAAHRNAIDAAAHVADDVLSVGSPVRCVPLSLDGKEGRRGLLLYVIDHKMGAVFRAGLKWVLRYKPCGSEKQPQNKTREQHKTAT